MYPCRTCTPMMKKGLEHNIEKSVKMVKEAINMTKVENIPLYNHSVNLAMHLYSEATKLGNNYAYKNFSVLIDYMTNARQGADRNELLKQYFDISAFLVDYDVEHKCMDMLVTRAFLNNPKLYRRLFASDGEIYGIYKDIIDKNMCREMYLKDMKVIDGMSVEKSTEYLKCFGYL